MKVVFMGTPDFAVPCLERLVSDGHDVAAVFTQPDKPKGRGYTLTPPPVKVCAMEHGIEVFQPKSMKDGEALEILKKIEPQIIVVVAFGKILPKEILDLPPYGCINVHGSLLPKYRGAAPMQWSVLNGDKITGITTMYMDVGLDTGDMLLKSETEIGENETSGELYDRMKVMGADLLSETIKKLEEGTVTRTKQKDEESSYASMLDKSMCRIDWNQSAERVHNKVRGLSPWPVAVAELNGKKVKIHKTLLNSVSGKKGDCGEIISLNPFVVACSDGAVEILELQLEGKKRMNSKDFLMGHRLNAGDRFS